MDHAGRNIARLPILCAIVGIFCFAPVSARPDELPLKNGTVLHGVVVPVNGLDSRTSKQNTTSAGAATIMWMVDDGVRRWFVPRRQAEDPIPEDDRLGRVTFELTSARTGRRGVPIDIQQYVERTEFDQFGRRRITLNTSQGPEHIFQAVTEITPDYLTVESTSHDWEHGLDLQAVPAETLEEMVFQAIDPENPDDRKAVVVFFIRAEMYPSARDELARIRDEFPELETWADEMLLEVAHVNALRGLIEIRRRADSGQHRLAYRYARAFPEDRVSADVLREARDLVAGYDEAARQIETAQMLLGALQSELDENDRQRVASLRTAVVDELTLETLPRLEPFLRIAQDDSLSAAEKLALAYSSWVLGPEDAVTNLDDAVRMWQARFLILEFLRNDDNPDHRQDLVSKLKEIEGVNAARAAGIVPQLPLPITMPPLETGEVHPIEVVDSWNQVTQTYSVVLPPEYSPQHDYPLLVVLHGAGVPPEKELTWWCGTSDRPGPAQQRGYIVIAPDYAGAEQYEYDYDAARHDAVIDSIIDARKRFRVDSDRIFLAGHGMGADACFDVAMSRPGVFAGVIPITGVCDKFCMFYRENAPDVGWYIVAGERDGVKLDRNARHLNVMMKRGYDVIYCEYKSRGNETYFEELPRIFDWMELHRRPPIPTEWEARILRHTDNRFYWLEMSGLPEKLAEPIIWDPPDQRRRPFTITGKLTPGNDVVVTHSADSMNIWLSPQMIDFDARLRVRNRGVVFNGFVNPELADLLEDLRVRGDRQRLYWLKLTL
ncbi:MAG: hypothetical protein DWQ34_12490 [Planctomycetota bacterium]|nr:MAG: hypothetical protein DWQ29_17355 [Planctomycetota bacterium]REJ92621.1 MAG: hypothetical protein DWQ34_12490 [Planctomycetota bacterium]REK26750.1 MAG: hypothetical protein DWQ41_09440 [Planctomycetota bacterium]REK28323.1 MAG: hypothetical protein DWQ45_25015 [Planctomycetota bacterium]